jgi:hypothetical protein
MTASGDTIRVPQDAPTIQAGVDRAREGDLVLIGPGVYRETVRVNTPRIVIRGLDRNTVILDGEFTRSDGLRITSDGVAVENLTVRNYLSNGLIFNGILDADGNVDLDRPNIDGWRGSYITAYNNELYGVYAFAARNGLFDHVYASGQADSGIYIGQCSPCNAVVTDSIATANSIGYEGTNAGGNVYLVNSDYSGNRVGMAINSSVRERAKPSRDVVVAGNRVDRNNNPVTPATEGVFGFGIAIGGASEIRVTKNRVRGNRDIGVAVTTQEDFLPARNRVEANDVAGNGTDLALFSSIGPELPIDGNCFADNSPGATFPLRLEQLTPCTAPATGSVTGRPTLGAQPPGVAVATIPPPPKQPSMPDPERAAPQPAMGLPPVVDLDTVRVPT